MSFPAVIEVELPPVAGGIGLFVVIESTLLRPHDERISGIIELHTFPSVAIIILIENKPAFLPVTLTEDHRQRRVPRGIIQLIEGAPAAVEHQLISGFEPFPISEHMRLVVVCKSTPLEKQAHIEIKFIPRTVVLVEVPGDGGIVDPLCEEDIDLLVFFVETVTGAVLRIAELRCIQQSNGPVSETVPVFICKDERDLPVVTQVSDPESGSMHFQKSGISAVILVEIGMAGVFPCLHHDAVPVNVVQDAVLVVVEHIHIIGTPVEVISHTGTRIVGHHLHIRLSITVGIAPVDGEVMRSGIDAIAIAVDQQAVTVRITRTVACLHIIIIIDPDDGNAVVYHRPQDVRITIPVEIFIDDVPNDRGHPPG